MMTSPVGPVLTLSQKELADEENDGIYDEDTDEDRCSLQDTDIDNPTSKSASYLLYKYYDLSQSKIDTLHTSRSREIEIQNSQQQLQSSLTHKTPRPISEQKPNEQHQPDQVSSCTICDEEYSSSEFIKLKCGHEFCQQCLKSHFRIQIESGITDNKCPELGCKIDADPETLEALLDINLLTKKEKFRENHQQAADPTTRYCPIPTCSAPISWTGKKEDGPGYKKCSCSCGNNFCVKCGEEWSLHGETFSCRVASRASKRRTVLEHKQDQAAEAWKKKNTKSCPKCGVNIQKIHGCDWMLCPQCANQFCWKCLDPHDHNLATHKHGPHGRSRRVAKKVAIGTGVTVAVLVLAIPALLVAGPLAINNRVRHGYWL